MKKIALKRWGKLSYIAVKISFLLYSVNAYSNNCEIAKSFSEKAICNDSILISLDVAMNENYKRMTYSNIGDGARQDLKITQKKWIIETNKCKTKSCIFDLYKYRLEEMCEYPVNTGIHANCIEYKDVVKNSPISQEEK